MAPAKKKAKRGAPKGSLLQKAWLIEMPLDILWEVIRHAPYNYATRY